MHRQKRYTPSYVRDGLWIVVDICDDLLEVHDERFDPQALTALREGAMDLLRLAWQLEKEAPRSPDPAA
jgi:hypothetical protein